MEWKFINLKGRKWVKNETKLNDSEIDELIKVIKVEFL